MESLHITFERTGDPADESPVLLTLNYRYEPLDVEKIIKLPGSPASVDSWHKNTRSESAVFNERFKKLVDNQNVHVALVERDVVDYEAILKLTFDNESQMQDLKSSKCLIVVDASKDVFREMSAALTTNWRAVVFSARTFGADDKFEALCKGEPTAFVEQVSTSVSIQFQFFY